MATASNTSGDKKCDTCKPKKTVGITSCCGCHRCFCGKHFIEHRDQLSENLNTVVNQHDEILQDLKIRIDHSSKGQAGNDDARNLFQKINEWENRTINACCDAADKARASVKQLFDKTKENNSFTKRLSSLANELEEQQESVSFVERDLDRWRKKLDELKNDINRPIEFPTNVIITTQDIDWEESIKISQLPSSNKIIKHYVIVFGEKGVGKTTFIHYAANFLANKRVYHDRLLQTTIEPYAEKIILNSNDLKRKFTFNRYSLPIDKQSSLVFLDPLSDIEDERGYIIPDSLSHVYGIKQFAAMIVVYDGTKIDNDPDWQNRMHQFQTLASGQQLNDVIKQFFFVGSNCSSSVLDFNRFRLDTSGIINLNFMQNSAYELFKTRSATASAETDFCRAMEIMEQILTKIVNGVNHQT